MEIEKLWKVISKFLRLYYLHTFGIGKVELLDIEITYAMKDKYRRKTFYKKYYYKKNGSIKWSSIPV